MANKKPRRPLSKAELLQRMHRSFRPRMKHDQVFSLSLLHNTQLDALVTGQADEEMLWQWVATVLTWLKAAELLERGLDEMTLQLDLVTRTLNRYRATGRIGLSGPDYQLAKVGVMVMDTLAEIIDQANASAAADWSEHQVNVMRSAVDQHRAELALGGAAA